MNNFYSFKCPIKGGAVYLEDCLDIHATAMKGRPQDVEDTKCAVAHACWMCPVRYAVRVGGPWSKPGSLPKWDSERDKPDTLPEHIERSALLYTPPKPEDYRRAGIEPVGKHDADLKELNEKARQGGKIKTPGGQGPMRGSVKTPQKPEKQSKPQSLADAATSGNSGDDYAETVNKLMDEHRDAQKPAESAPAKTQRSTPKAKKPAQGEAQSAPASSSKRMSMAERARQMKEKKNG